MKSTEKKRVDLTTFPKLKPDKDDCIVYSFEGFVSYHESVEQWRGDFEASLRFQFKDLLDYSAGGMCECDFAWQDRIKRAEKEILGSSEPSEEGDE